MKKNIQKTSAKKQSLTQQKQTKLGGSKGLNGHLHLISKDKNNKDYYS